MARALHRRRGHRRQPPMRDAGAVRDVWPSARTKTPECPATASRLVQPCRRRGCEVQRGAASARATAMVTAFPTARAKYWWLAMASALATEMALAFAPAPHHRQVRRHPGGHRDRLDRRP